MRPTPLPNEREIRANMLLGPQADVAPLPPPRAGGVWAALDEVLARALRREPCIVSFSGGRDSSAVLALAADVARRHGLAMPVPAIMRFPHAAATDETSWQEAVLAHLGLGNAEILTLTTELDGLGESAVDVLQRHSVIWPGNAYMHRPVIDVAKGGTVLTGIGGDELFSTTAPRRSMRQFALAMMPSRVRTGVWLNRHSSSDYHWLTAAGQAEVQSALAQEHVACPYAWDDALRYWHASRAFAALDGALRLVAEGFEVEIVNPFLDRQVLSELAEVGGRRGFASRTDAMHWLCGDRLPAASMGRSTKASFGEAVWGPEARRFARDWDGRGLDSTYVDAGSLKAELLGPDPDFRTILLLHQAWLRWFGARDARE